MAILRLALTNVRVQLNRSISTLIIVGIAAMVLTSGMSMSLGTTKLAANEYRDYLGGDILVFSPGVLRAAPVNETSPNLVRRVLVDSGFNPALKFFPNLETRGYFARNEWEYAPITKEQSISIESLPQVGEISPFKTMPAFINGERVQLRQPPDYYGEFLSYGRLPQNGSKQLEVVINTYGFKDPNLQPDPEPSPYDDDAPPPGLNIPDLPDIEKLVGQTITIVVPAYGRDKMGLPCEVYSIPAKTYTAVIVGRVSWPTRGIAWLGPFDRPEFEQGYVHAPEVYLTNESWDTIWHEQSGGIDYLPTAALISLRDLNQVNAVLTELSRSHPELSFHTMPKLQQQAEWFSPIDHFYRAPGNLWRRTDTSEDFTEQDDFGHITAILLLLNAGMLMASQMLAAVSTRKKEIGILRSLGATQREVISMILCEALMLTLIGATTGFVLVRIAAFHQAVTNSTPFLAVFSATIKELLIVLAATSSMALVFGVLPALKVAKITVMEVLRNE